MKSTLRELSPAQVQQVSGGHGALFYLELMHIFVGAREFINYFADLYVNGFKDIDEKDYFTQFIAYLFTEQKPAQ